MVVEFAGRNERISYVTIDETLLYVDSYKYRRGIDEFRGVSSRGKDLEAKDWLSTRK